MSVDVTSRLASGMGLMLVAIAHILVAQEHIAVADVSGFGATMVLLGALGLSVAVSGAGAMIDGMENWPLDGGRAGTVQNLAIALVLAGMPAAMIIDSPVVSEMGLIQAIVISVAMAWIAAGRFIRNNFDLGGLAEAALNRGETA